MATSQSVKAKLQGLIDSANAATGGSDTTLDAAVGTLIDGFGAGGYSLDDIVKKNVAGEIDITTNSAILLSGIGNLEGYKKITGARIGGLGTINYSTGILSSCDLLEWVELPGCISTNGCNYFLAKNKALKRVVLPDYTRMVNYGMCAECPSLEILDFQAALESFPNTFALSSQVLKAFILRRTSGIVILSSASSLTNTSISTGTGYIYVPAAQVDSYKAATNWSTYAAQFRALEDYTVDGTTTGELDESKITEV